MWKELRTFIGDEIARYISEINERKQSEAKAIQPKPEAAGRADSARAATRARGGRNARRATATRRDDYRGSRAPGSPASASTGDVRGGTAAGPCAVPILCRRGDNRGVEEILLEAVAGEAYSRRVWCASTLHWKNCARSDARTLCRLPRRTAQSLGYVYDKANRNLRCEGVIAMKTKQTRVSDVQRWWEYEYGYEWRFYESDDDRPTDSERAESTHSRPCGSRR